LTLEQWIGKLLSLNLADPRLKSKLDQIRRLSHAKALEQQVEKLPGTEAFSGGQGYLKAALISANPTLKSELLKGALAQAKAEADIETFVKTATAMADSTPASASSIHEDLAVQLTAIGDYAAAIPFFQKAYSEKQGQEVLDSWVGVLLMLRDWEGLSKLPIFQTSVGVQSRFLEQATDAIRAVRLPDSLLVAVLQKNASPDILFSMGLMGDGIGSSVHSLWDQKMIQACTQNRKMLVCAQKRFVGAALQLRAKFSQALGGVKGLEASAKEFQNATALLQSFAGSDQPNLEAAVNSQLYQVYQAFAKQLGQFSVPPDVAAVVRQKANDAIKASADYLQNCKKFLQPLQLSISVSCQSSPAEAFFQNKLAAVGSVDYGEADSSEFKDLQKKLFSHSDPETMLALGQAYFRHGQYNQAVATAQKSSTLGLLGCSLMHLGFEQEAQFHWKQVGITRCPLE
jgi:tetratricopeptide (TPR) repeat protein